VSLRELKVEVDPPRRIQLLTRQKSTVDLVRQDIAIAQEFLTAIRRGEFIGLPGRQTGGFFSKTNYSSIPSYNLNICNFKNHFVQHCFIYFM